MNQLLETVSIGDASEAPHLIIHCPHGATVDDIITRDPALWDQLVKAAEASGLSEHDLREFINIEADVFSFELAHALAEKIRHEIQDIRIQIIKVCVPRALVDMNRNEDHCLGKVFHFDEYPELVKRLKDIHQEIFEGLQTAFVSLEGCPGIEPSGTLFEIHTMGPVTPIDVPISPETLHERLRIWKQMGGEPRQIDIIDEMEEDGKRWFFSDKEICDELQQAFRERAVRNLPYWGRPYLLSYHWSQLVDSHVVLDFPKHELSRERLDGDERYPIENLTMDEHKVHKVSETLARVLVPILRRRMRVTSETNMIG